MNETSLLLAESATRLFADHFDEAAARISREGHLSDPGWTAIEEAGLPIALVGEAAGGFGLPAADALELVRIGGRFASPAPLGETMIANWLLSRAGLPLASGPATFLTLACDGETRFAGRAGNVPWAALAETLVVVADKRIARIEARDAMIEPIGGPGALPRAAVEVDFAATDADSCPVGDIDAAVVKAAGAAMRTLEIAGALERVAEMTVAYASERVQFGRPIGKQQAIQQQLAILATQAAAANAAADIAAAAFASHGNEAAIAAAKSRAGEAAGIGASIAHQVHGAIGFTREHPLHLFTRALWTWRDEFGSERYWRERLGALAFDAGADGFWPFVTGATVAEVA